MRLLIPIIFSFLLLNLASCQTAKKANQEKTLVKADSTKNTSSKIFLFKNKKLEISDNNGSLSYVMVDDPKTNVIRFSYEKDMEKAAYDGGYREEVVFEFPNYVNQQNYVDSALQSTKMLFGRYCFCRGKTGLYKVNEGELHLDTVEKEPHFYLKFKINEVPQVTNEVTY